VDGPAEGLFPSGAKAFGLAFVAIGGLIAMRAQARSYGMIRIVPTTRDLDSDIYDAIAKAFGGYYQTLRHSKDGYVADSAYDWDVSRLAIKDELIVGHIGVYRYAMRVGQARLLTGGLGAVLTHGEHRKRGVARQMLEDLLPAMRRAGYDFSVLFGIRDFYHRFGFVQAWPSVRHVVKTADLPDQKLAMKLRKVDDREMYCRAGAIMRIYDREYGTTTGTAVRPLYRPRRRSTRIRCHALLDSAGRVRGYVGSRLGEDELDVVEVGGLKAPCGVGQLLAAIKALAARENRRKVRLAGIPYHHPLCVILRAGTCTVEMDHIRSGGAMGRVISLRGCLHAMAGELAERLRKSAAKGFRGVLSISGDGEVAALRIASGSIRLAEGRPRTSHRIVAGAYVARLILGSDSPQSLSAQGQVAYHGAAAELAEAMFPRQWPTLCNIDHY
jgi:predicted N-acetyltransferase YhbS